VLSGRRADDPLLRCHSRPTRLSRSQAMAKGFPEPEKMQGLTDGSRGLCFGEKAQLKAREG